MHMQEVFRSKTWEDKGRVIQENKSLEEKNQVLKKKFESSKKAMSFERKIKATVYIVIITFLSFCAGYHWINNFGYIDFLYLPHLLTILLPSSTIVYLMISELDKQEKL